MISWLLEQSIFLTIFVSILLVFRHQLRNVVGASSYYFLWAIVPIQLLLSMLPISIFYPSYVNFNTVVVTASGVVNSGSEIVQNHGDLWFYFWLAGSLLVGGFICSQHLIFSWKQTGFEPNKNQLKNLESIRLSSISKIKISVSDTIGTPVVRGVTSYEILLPTSFFELEREEQQLILEHELVHLSRGDLFWNMLALTILTFFWFNPVCWVGYRHFRQAQEMACDAKVLEGKTQNSRKIYAIAFLNQSVTTKQSLLTTLHYGGKENMKERLGNIKTGSNYHWVAIPTVLALLLGSFTFQAIGDTSNKPNIVVVSPIKRANPVYPEYAEKKGIEGTVLLNFSIEMDGGVSDIQVVESDHDGLFDASAILALQKWVYSTPSNKLRNQYVAIEFALTDEPKTTQFSNVEKIQIKGED